MKISRLADYAVLICCHLAAQEECLCNVTVLAEKTDLGSATVSKVMKTLSRANIVTSCRGVNGGYALAEPPYAISVCDIVEAIDGPIALTNCLSEKHHTCVVSKKCDMHPQWNKLNVAVRRAFKDLMLSDIMPEASVPPLQIKRTAAKA